MESPLGFHKDTIETPWRIICDPIEIPRRSRTVFTDTSELMVVEDEYTDADGHGYEYGYGYRYAYGYGYGDGDGDGDADVDADGMGMPCHAMPCLGSNPQSKAGDPDCSWDLSARRQ